MRAPTDKQLAAGQRRSLRAMRTKLINMAAQWEDLDPYFEEVLAELADKAEELAIELTPDPTPEELGGLS